MLDIHHGGAFVAPYREEAGFVEFITQRDQMRRRDFQDVQLPQRGQSDLQCFASQAIVIGGDVLFGETSGHQRLQVTMDLARGHAHVFGEL